MAIISPYLLESDKGAGPCRKGCSAPGLLGLTDFPLAGTHCRQISSANGEKTKFLHLTGPSLILYMWKNSWRDRWVKRSIIYNTCSVYGEKICSYFSHTPLFSSMGDSFYLMLHLHDLKKIKSARFGLTMCQSWCECYSQISSLCREDRGKTGRGWGGQGWGNNTTAIPVERNNLHNFVKAVFVRSDGSIKA